MRIMVSPGSLDLKLEGPHGRHNKDKQPPVRFRQHTVNLMLTISKIRVAAHLLAIKQQPVS